jgi:hypothetical protein
MSAALWRVRLTEARNEVSQTSDGRAVERPPRRRPIE